MNDRSSRPLRLIFFLFHLGYIRQFEAPLRLLAAQGHHVHLAYTAPEKDEGDLALAERLVRECPTITFGPAPMRGYLDGWRRTSTLVRAFTDLARYVDPRYAEAPALRARMAKKIRLQVLSGRADPVSTALLVRLVAVLSQRSDAALASRLLRVLRLLEQAVPTSRRIDEYLRERRPDAVLATPVVEYASPQVDYVKSAQRLGIPVAACIASWDNLTNKGLLRVVPDRVTVWNELQVSELAEMHGVPRERAVVTGAQRFDEWFERQPDTSPEQFKRKVGLPDDAPYLLYLCSSWFIAPNEAAFVRRWLERLRGSDEPTLRDLSVLVRPHPQNAAQWSDVDLDAFGAATIWPRAGAQPDAGEQRADFFDSLSHSAAVVGVNTSAMIESAILGKRVFTLLDPENAGTQEGTLHFHYLLRENGGFLEVARTFDEHHAQLARALEDPEGDRRAVLAFVERFVRPHGLTTPAAPHVAEAIVELARSTPPPQPRTPVAAYALRVPLGLLAATATASTLVGHALERVRGRSR